MSLYKILITAFIVLIVILVIIFFLTRQRETDIIESPPQGNVVVIRNFVFDPNRLEIQAGETVEFNNTSNQVHTVTSDSFDSGNIGINDIYQRTFEEPGEFSYHCKIHPEMTGTIIVK